MRAAPRLSPLADLPCRVCDCAFVLSRRERLPVFHSFSEGVHAGGLISYGPHQAEMVSIATSYVAKILKGAKPAELPVEQPTRFELVINLKTAKEIGLEIPPTLLARADEVIE